MMGNTGGWRRHREVRIRDVFWEEVARGPRTDTQVGDSPDV